MREKFNVYLPVAYAASSQTAVDEANEKDLSSWSYRGNQERILVLEDQQEVRNVVATALTENGYIVRKAKSLTQAKALFENNEETFDLLFSDVILPDGNGIDFAMQITQQHPDINVLLTSGYTEEQSRPDTIEQRQFHYMQKPYQISKILKTVYQIFAGRRLNTWPIFPYGFDPFLFTVIQHSQQRTPL